MTEWIALGLGALALAAVIGWLKAHREARDWERCCFTLGEQYDLMLRETAAPRPFTESRKRGQQWLN